jgi:hypothetical protein
LSATDETQACRGKRGGTAWCIAAIAWAGKERGCSGVAIQEEDPFEETNRHFKLAQPFAGPWPHLVQPAEASLRVAAQHQHPRGAHGLHQRRLAVGGQVGRELQAACSGARALSDQPGSCPGGPSPRATSTHGGVLFRGGDAWVSRKHAHQTIGNSGDGVQQHRLPAHPGTPPGWPSSCPCRSSWLPGRWAPAKPRPRRPPTPPRPPAAGSARCRRGPGSGSAWRCARRPKPCGSAVGRGPF